MYKVTNATLFKTDSVKCNSMITQVTRLFRIKKNEIKPLKYATMNLKKHKIKNSEIKKEL